MTPVHPHPKVPQMCQAFKDFYLHTRKDLCFRLSMYIMALVSFLLIVIGFIGLQQYPTDYGYAIAAIIGVSGLPWPVMTAIFFWIGKCSHTPDPLATLYEV